MGVIARLFQVNSLHNSLSKSVGMNQSINHFFNEYRKGRMHQSIVLENL